jgi:hypothetical protein
LSTSITKVTALTQLTPYIPLKQKVVPKILLHKIGKDNCYTTYIHISVESQIT